MVISQKLKPNGRAEIIKGNNLISPWPGREVIQNRPCSSPGWRTL